jgi:hypothetical protein
MPTSDGITDRDWDKVHTLALLVVKASASKPSNLKAAKARLLRYLERLESKYGVLPSIVATRADYTDNNKSQESLLLRAYSLSKRRKDASNQAEIAHSLAAFYIEDTKQFRKAAKWLAQLSLHARRNKSRYLGQECLRLRAEMNELAGKG